MDINNTPLSMLGLSPRTLNALSRAHLARVGEVLVMSDEQLLNTRNFNEKCLTELDQGLAKMDLFRG